MNDPISLDSDEEMANLHSADLNDKQFELVKERFHALLGKYGTLWRAMLPKNENKQPNTYTVASAARFNKNGCAEDECACVPMESFLPLSLMEKTQSGNFAVSDPDPPQDEEVVNLNDNYKHQNYHGEEEELEPGVAYKDENLGDHEGYDEFQGNEEPFDVSSMPVIDAPNRFGGGFRGG